jgi:hypothetical protein
MTLTPRMIVVLAALFRYGYARAAQLRDAIARAEGRPGWDKDASLTREILRSLRAQRFVHRHDPKLSEVAGQAAPPVYVLSQRGSCALAEARQDVRWLIQVERDFRDWMSVNHWCGLTALHLTTDAAFEAQLHVCLHRLAMEHAVVDAGAKRPSDRYALHETVSESPPIYCCPDSAMEVSVATHPEHRRVLYVEYETGADGSPSRVAHKKHKGYALLSERGLFRRRFPEARDVRVIAVAPYDSFRDGMIAEFRRPRGEAQPLPGAELWLFVTRAAITPNTFLHGDVFYSIDRGPFPLVPRPAAPALPAAHPPTAGEGAGDRPEEGL